MRASENIFKRLSLAGSPHQLALFRIALGLQIFMAVHSKVFPLLLTVGDTQDVTTVFPTWLEKAIAQHMVPWLVLFCKIFSGLLVLGFLTRIILPILTAAFILLYSFYYMGANAPVQWLYFWVPLIILCFSNPSHVWSLDAWLFKKRDSLDLKQYRWPVELIIVWIAFIYVAAGLSKITPLSNGVRWIMYGTTTQYIAYFRFLDSPLYYLFGRPFFDYSKVNWIWAFLSLFGMVAELGSILLLVTRKYNFIIFMAISFLHFGIYLLGIGAFLLPFLILSIALINPSWFNNKFLNMQKFHDC